MKVVTEDATGMASCNMHSYRCVLFAIPIAVACMLAVCVHLICIAIVCVLFAISASATAPSFAYVSSPVPAALPLCRGIHKVHCTAPFRMACTNYKIDKLYTSRDRVP